MPALSPGSLSDMALRGRIGAFVLHSRRDPRETTAAARAAFLGKFLDAVDPDRELPEAERLRRAEAARRAHFARLALASARSRAKRKRKPGPELRIQLRSDGEFDGTLVEVS